MNHNHILPYCTLAALFASSAMGQMNLLGTFSANIDTRTGAGEIISFDSATQRLFTTQSDGSSFGVNWFDFSNPSSPVAGGTIDFSNLYGGGASQIDSLTSVATDPLGRGFGAAAVVPTLNADYSTLGRIGIFDTSTGTLLQTLDLGYHPDAVSFTPDGSKILVANEAEYVDIASGTNRPGGISVIDVSGITGQNKTTAIPALTQANVTTTDILGSNFPGLRYNSLPGATNAAVESVDNNIEAEYITSRNGKAYATLQENNAIGVYNLATNVWEAVIDMGTRDMNNVDLTRRNGINLEATTPFKGIPMPDTIASFEVAGTTYLVTANEGDARGADDADVKRVEDARADGDLAVSIDSKYDKLNISLIDGLNGDGKVVTPHVFGSRSFTIINADTGTVVFDSLNSTATNLESIIANLDPAVWPEPIDVDNRSDDKGPEPEGLTVGTIDGKPMLFLAMERSDNVMMFDLSDPVNPVFVDIQRAAGTEAPESLLFLENGKVPGFSGNLLLVAYEDTNNIAVFSVVPEPAHFAVLAGAGLLALISLRRRASR